VNYQEAAERTDVVVLVPIFGNPDYDCMQAVAATGFNYLVLKNDPWICRARCSLAQEALDKGYRWLLWIDHDIRFNPQQLRDLLEEAERRDLDIVGGIYSKKRMGEGWACTFNKQHGERIRIGDPTEEPRESNLVPLGFTVTQRRVFEKQIELGLAQPYHSQGNRAHGWFMHIIDEDQAFLGEDHSFVRRSQQAGFKAWIHPGYTVGHVGGYVYTARDALGEKLDVREVQQVDPKEPGGET
jgi:hypothetical protein